MPQQHRRKLKNSAQAPTLRVAFDLFMLDCRARRLRDGTIGFYTDKLPPFTAFLRGEGVVTVADITPTHVRQFMAGLREKGHNPGGQHAYARAIKTWLNFLVAEGVLKESPAKGVKMPKRDKQPLPAFTAADVERLLDACRYERDFAAVLFLLDTGLRAAEFVALNVGDVDAMTGAVQVRRGKGGKSRRVYIGVRTRRALQRYLWGRDDVAAADPLFVSFRGGGRWTYSGLQQTLRRLGEAAEVENCHPHTFRRTFALWSLRAGMNIYALQELMGHADLTVLRRYLAIVQDDLEAAHREHGPVDSHLKK